MFGSWKQVVAVVVFALSAYVVFFAFWWMTGEMYLRQPSVGTGLVLLGLVGMAASVKFAEKA